MVFVGEVIKMVMGVEVEVVIMEAMLGGLQWRRRLEAMSWKEGLEQEHEVELI